MWRLAFVSALLLLAFENASLAQDCGTDEKCLQANYIACANGAMCPADRKCSTDGRRCLSRERVDCGGYSCGPGKVCGPANACVAKNATPGRRSYAADDARHKDSRSVRPNADNNILAYLPEQDKTLMSLKAFIDSHSGAARSTPSSVPAAKTVPQAKQDGGQHVAPANNAATNPATIIQDARNISSTVTAIKELQAQIKRAEESKAGAEQEIKKLQTKMQELSLKRWQEEADQLKAAASSAVTAPNAESVKMNCKVLGASSASADKFQLQCERQQMTTCDAGSRAK